MLQGKRFGSNVEVIAETEAYFESKDESFYKKGIEKLEKRWNECITLEGNYVDGSYLDQKLIEWCVILFKRPILALIVLLFIHIGITYF